ncbi:MsnO8 family LLM class oxidoreductase [Bacillus lacus]|uniref:MsnO8 family LLM class oxidoreductase n=1 Tax=Metabacillus lacus TaxID=1983721 RepID=A0A7X2IW30_9BACI|nr:MsnO8 family LLM class oxidoreductase [Metabacillus lacus]
MRLSILEQSAISAGETAEMALQHTLSLVMEAEQLGFHRFWVAEHHNTAGLAGSSPEVIMSHLAAVTKTIKVGSGALLLPQYSPLKIAENFLTLEAMFPGRVDLGIGRSPGGDAATRLALTDGLRKSLSEFPRQVDELKRYLGNDPVHKVTAFPSIDRQPQVWLLGTSVKGAKLAAEKGLAFTFGHFLYPAAGKQAISTYKAEFRATPYQKKPQHMVCVFVVCAKTEEQAEKLALSQDIWLLRVEKGENSRIPSYSEAVQYPLSVRDREKISHNRSRMIIGTPKKVKAELNALSQRYECNEFLILTNLHRFEDKLQSFQLLAKELIS